MPRSTRIQQAGFFANLILLVSTFLLLIQSFRENQEHGGNTASGINLAALAQILIGVAQLTYVSYNELGANPQDTDTARNLALHGRNGSVVLTAGTALLTTSLHMDRFLLHAGTPLLVSEISTLFPIGALCFTAAYQLMSRGRETRTIPALFFTGALLFDVGAGTFVATNAIAAREGLVDNRTAGLYLAGAGGYAIGASTFLILSGRELWQRRRPQEGEGRPLLSVDAPGHGNT